MAARAAPELAKRHPGLRVLIAGGGDVYDELKAQADAANQAAGYPLLHLPGARTDINEIVAAGDVFVGVSRAALEAMAAAKPVIIAGNEGYHSIFTPDKLEEAKLGNFCCRGLPMCTPESLLADADALLSAGPETWKQQGAYNRQVIFDHYSVARMTEDALSVYRQVWRKRTAVISGYYGYHNLGDDAILLSIRRRLARLSGDVELVALSNSPESTLAEYGVNAVKRFSVGQVRRAIRQADLLISGGGSLLQDRTSTRSILYYLFVIRTALHYNKPVMLYANGIGPVTKPTNRRRVRDVVSRADAITLRDGDSLAELQAMGVDHPRMTVTADPVFTLNGIPPEQAKKRLLDEQIPLDQPILAVSMRQSAHIAGRLDELAAFCDKAAQTHTVLFIIMQTPDDRAVTEDIRARMTARSPAFRRRTGRAAKNSSSGTSRNTLLPKWAQISLSSPGTAAYSPVRSAWSAPLSMMHRAWPAEEKSKSSRSTTGLALSWKSIVTMPPTEEAIWSSRPLGLPKKTFSAYCPVWAMRAGEHWPSKNSSLKMLPSSTSKAALELRPLPLNTLETV